MHDEPTKIGSIVLVFVLVVGSIVLVFVLDSYAIVSIEIFAVAKAL